MPVRYPSVAARGVDTSRPPSERYHILGRIALGGQAEIYLARMFTPIHGLKEYVLKRLRPDLQVNDEYVKMFYDEAQIASRLRHKNIGEIVELGEIDDSLFFTSELIRGVNLRELHQRSLELEKGVPLELVLRIGTGVLEALEYAHAMTDEHGSPLNIIHRDVSPQNILVTYGGEIKLVDFGVAKAEGRLHQTRAGLIKGKPLYMSPEQFFGDELDGRADLFSLTEVLFELALHRHPFFRDQGAMMEALLATKNLKPYFPEAAFFPAANIFLRGLEPDRSDRFESAASMRRAIEQLQEARELHASAEELGHHVQKLFADRLELEERARRKNDDVLLIESLRVGHRHGAASPPEPEIPMEAPIDLPGEAGEEVSITAAIRSPARVASHNPPKIGRIGPYSLEKCIGVGAMAEVFRASLHGALGFSKTVAIKRVLPRLAEDPRFVDLFMSEARLSARLLHPNIVQVLDLGTDGDERYYVMEYVDGWDLATILERCRQQKDQVPVTIACRIMADVSAGLYAAHTAVDENSLPLMIVHRDVAPQNVLISKNGEIKLTDFGIARADDHVVMVAETSVGEIRGKPAYMAPERLVPDGEATVDPRVDIFSAGAVLFELLALRPLFKRATAFETLMAVQRDPVPAISTIRTDVPKALDAIIECACSRWRDERYPTARALQLELERILANYESPVTGAQVAQFLADLFDTHASEELKTDPHLDLAEIGMSDDEMRTVTHRMQAWDDKSRP